MKKPRVSRVQKQLLQQMRAGIALRVQKGDPPYFLDGHDAVNQRTVRVLLRRGVIKPAEDGLFGDTQTLVLA